MRKIFQIKVATLILYTLFFWGGEKIKLSLYLIKLRVMKSCGKVEAYFSAVLTSGLDAGGWSG
jgi:hypothetical protein